MDARQCQKLFGYCIAALISVSIVSAGTEPVGLGLPETSDSATISSSIQGAASQDSVGADTAGRFDTLNFKDGEWEGNLAVPSQPAQTLSDFAIECSLKMRNLTNGQFNLRIGSFEAITRTTRETVFHLCYDAQNGWEAGVDADGSSILKPVEGMKPLLSAAWYHLRFVGRNWNETNAYFDLQLVEPDGNKITTPATHCTLIQDSSSTARPARHFTLANSAGINPGFDVTKVSLTAITPYKGLVNTGVNTKTMLGKVMCGYQGWFGAPGDGSSEQGWRHWTKNRGPLTDGNAKVDLWPDVSELDASQRFKTDFKMPDGRSAEVFSSFERPTVLKHFEWMQDYGIDGVFVQRFANGLKNPTSLKYCNTVLANCREGANLHGRTYAVMYDLSGLPAGHIDDVINDWRALRKEMVITEDPAYLNHRGKPVVAVWGIGFNDGREYTLAECRRLIDFLKNNPEAGGCTVMLGVPTNWRELKGDAVNDPALLDIIAMADIVSPWTVGRYSNPYEVAQYAEKIMKPDLAWCRQRGIDFLPVVFPGFSWHNMKNGPSNQIPRLHGQFLWSQFLEVKRADISMIYVAMFDEVDEGTAIFKCVNDVPQGEKSKFVTFEGLPSDFYLRMVGDATRLIRNKASVEENSPLSQN